MAKGARLRSLVNTGTTAVRGTREADLGTFRLMPGKRPALRILESPIARKAIALTLIRTLALQPTEPANGAESHLDRTNESARIGAEA